MLTRTLKSMALGALALGVASAALADGHAGTRGFALANGGKTLVVMADIAAPTQFETYDLAVPLHAIAYRPVTGVLLGYTDGGICEIDITTGALKDLKATFVGDAAVSTGAMVGFDFNNQIDAVRVVSTAGDNLVYFPEGFGDNDERAGSIRRFTALAYAEGDSNAGTTPHIFANAYTNAIPGQKASATFQYALDAETDSLVSLANNEGTLATIAEVTVNGAPLDLSSMGGFDIVSASEGDNAAYAVLQGEGVDKAGLFAIDLETGAATPLAGLPLGGITGFAVAK